ncbi:MAG: bifunctional 5,10-methylenetetrahydrofolate dehydrogenase/5,10-methenyltetrahydrofolate cyclohydrolase [Candidatus Levyibacteriota bacterium]
MKIDGKEIAKNILEDLKIRVEKLKEKNIIPGLSIILVGDNPASKAYVRQKELKAEKIGANAVVLNLDSKTSNSELLKTIEQWNNDSNIHGMIVQRPLPSHIDEKKIDLATDPKKDIDSFHPKSPYPMPLAAAVLKILEEIYLFTNGAGRHKIFAKRGTTHHNKDFYRGESFHEAMSSLESPKVTVSRDEPLDGESEGRLCLKTRQTEKTTSAINPINFKEWLKSKRIVVIGKGKTGGGPTIQMLKKMGVELQIIDSKTQNPKDFTKSADIIISTVGKPNILKPEMIKKGIILISVGQHKGIDGKFHGDYEENEIKNIASFYTPTPGGIGPVNVAMLLENLVTAAQN